MQGLRTALFFFPPKSLRTKAKTAAIAITTNFFAAKGKTKIALNSPALAATPPKIRAAIPYSATLSGGWRGTGQLSQFSEGRCTLLLRSFCLLCLVPDGRFIFQTSGHGSAEAERFVQLMCCLEAFSGIRVLTYVLMSNHFHLLCEVPQAQDALRGRSA